MPNTKTRSAWSQRNLYFFDGDGVANGKVFQQFCQKVALAAGNADAIAFSYENPYAAAIYVTDVLVEVTTAGGTAGALLDVGFANDATTGADNIGDACAALNTVGLYGVKRTGTNGYGVAKIAAKGSNGSFVNGQIKAQNAANLAGYAYIFYTMFID